MKHLRKLGESYIVHFIEAVMIAIVSVAAGIVVLVHAIIPAIFETTGSSMLKWILNRNDSRNK